MRLQFFFFLAIQQYLPSHTLIPCIPAISTMNKPFRKKGPGARRRRARSPTNYPMLGRYEVRSPSKIGFDTNPCPRTKLKLGRYEVYVPDTAMPRPAKILAPCDVHRGRKLYHQTVPMLGSYEVHPGGTLHHQTAPIPRSCGGHPGGPLNQIPMLGSHQIHPRRSLQQTIPMPKSYAHSHPLERDARYPWSKSKVRDNKPEYKVSTHTNLFAFPHTALISDNLDRESHTSTTSPHFPLPAATAVNVTPTVVVSLAVPTARNSEPVATSHSTVTSRSRIASPLTVHLTTTPTRYLRRFLSLTPKISWRRRTFHPRP